MRLIPRQESREKAIIYACTGAVFAAAMAACLLRGLFFAREMYWFLTIWFALCTVLAVWAARIFKLRAVEKTSLLLLGCPLAIVVLYAWAGLRGPVSAQDTADELLRWGFYASFAIMAYFCAGCRPGARLLAAIWHVTGMTIGLSALLAVCAGLKLPYGIAYTSASEVSATGARLAGLLQYPNTFGAVMAVFLLERLFAVAALMEQAQPKTADRAVGDMEKSGRNGNGGRGGVLRERGVAQGIREWSDKNGIREWKQRGRNGNGGRGGVLRGAGGRQLLRMLPLFPCAAALLLSESRGAWLAAALASAAALLWKRQLCVPLLLAGAAPMAAAALFYRQLARAGLAVEPVSGLLLLAGLWGAALLGGAWLCRRRAGAAGGGRAARVALAAAIWTAAGSAVLLHVRERITGPSSTVNARGLFYRDAWKLAAEAPWLGRGGGTWRSSYLAAQSRPYVGSQVHSGYLDLLLNLGGIGLGVSLLLLVAAGCFVAAAPRLLPPLLALALHSAVDFDWSYGLVWLLLCLLPALARAEKLHHAAADDPPILPVPPMSLAITGGPGSAAAEADSTLAAAFPVSAATTPFAASLAPLTPVSGRLRRTMSFANLQRLLPVVALTLLCGVTLALSILSFQAMKGEMLYKQAAGVSQREERISLLRQSLQWNPRQPQAVAVLSRMLPESEGSSLLLKSLGYSPQNAALNWELAKQAMEGDIPGTALYWVRRGERLDIFNAAKRIAAAEGLLDMSVRRLGAGDRKGARQSAEAGLELLRQYRLLADQEASKGMQHNDRQFGAKKEAEDINLRLEKARADACYFQAEILRRSCS
ncbi:O-Antigen ligase [compost metagenome]